MASNERKFGTTTAGQWVVGLVLAVSFTGCVKRLEPAPSLFDDTEWSGASLVQTRYGQIEGRSDSEETWSWKGIPYAAPPVGELRWRAPRPPTAWLGVRVANDFGNAAPQKLPVLGAIGSEDCLYLNVWRPKTAERGLPVYVYVHGGGNSIGRSDYPDYSGHAVAARSNMVYVSLNYRLSVLGWFRSPALAEGEEPLDASGNYGTLDIVAALRWVKENISAFGGDPDNVTLSGESAGAFNVMSLLVSPQASLLFHRAIVESGLAVMQSTATAEQAARKVTLRLLVSQGRAPDLGRAEHLLATMPASLVRSFLLSVSAADLVRSLDPSPVGLAMADHPTIYADGVVLPSDGFRSFRNGHYANQVPLVIGATKDETRLFLFFGKLYQQDPALYQAIADHRSALWWYVGVDYVARGITSQPHHAPVYAYRFDWGSPDAQGKSPLPGDLGRRLGAFHSSEVPFFLGTGVNAVSFLTGPFLTWANEPGRKALTEAVMHYLAAFARTGDPNGPGSTLPRWEPWDSRDGAFKALLMDVEGDAARFSPLLESPSSLVSIKARAPAGEATGGSMGLLNDFVDEPR